MFLHSVCQSIVDIVRGRPTDPSLKRQLAGGPEQIPLTSLAAQESSLRPMVATAAVWRISTTKNSRKKGMQLSHVPIFMANSSLFVLWIGRCQPIDSKGRCGFHQSQGAVVFRGKGQNPISVHLQESPKNCKNGLFARKKLEKMFELWIGRWLNAHVLSQPNWSDNPRLGGKGQQVEGLSVTAFPWHGASWGNGSSQVLPKSVVSLCQCIYIHICVCYAFICCRYLNKKKQPETTNNHYQCSWKNLILKVHPKKIGEATDPTWQLDQDIHLFWFVPEITPLSMAVAVWRCPTLPVGSST